MIGTPLVTKGQRHLQLSRPAPTRLRFLNTAKPVDEIGPTQMLFQVEACGICFSNTKLLHAFDSHPRKAEVVSNIDLAALPVLPEYVLDDAEWGER